MRAQLTCHFTNAAVRNGEDRARYFPRPGTEPETNCSASSLAVAELFPALELLPEVANLDRWQRQDIHRPAGS